VYLRVYERRGILSGISKTNRGSGEVVVCVNTAREERRIMIFDGANSVPSQWHEARRIRYSYITPRSLKGVLVVFRKNSRMVVTESLKGRPVSKAGIIGILRNGEYMPEGI
jgi:hypothetical protein